MVMIMKKKKNWGPPNVHPFLVENETLEGAIKERCLETLPDHTRNRYCQRPPAIFFKTFGDDDDLDHHDAEDDYNGTDWQCQTVFVIFSSIPKTSWVVFSTWIWPWCDRYLPFAISAKAGPLVNHLSLWWEDAEISKIAKSAEYWI